MYKSGGWKIDSGGIMQMMGMANWLMNTDNVNVIIFVYKFLLYNV